MPHIRIEKGLRIETPSANDDMHVLRRWTVSDPQPVTESDYERMYNNVQRLKAGETLGSYAECVDEHISDPMIDALKPVADADRAHTSAASHHANDRTYTVGPTTWSDRISGLRNDIIDFLTSKNLPHPFQLYLTKADISSELPETWESMSVEERSRAAPLGTSVEIGWAFVRRTAKPFEPVWFAAEIAMRLMFLERATAERREELFFEIGVLQSQWSSRRHLPNVRRGKKNKESTRRGGKNAAAKQNFKEQRELVLKTIAYYREKGHSKSHSAELAARDGIGPSMSTNRSTWYRYGHAR